jgi:hypothetical protein
MGARLQDKYLDSAKDIKSDTIADFEEKMKSTITLKDCD